MSRHLLAAAISTAFLAPGLAMAQTEPGFYVGASANWLDADFKDSNDLSFDDSETTWGLRAGYMFNQWFGVEGGYIDLGNYSGDSGVEVDADAWQLAGVGNWDLTDQFSLYGKLGAFFVNAKSDQFVPGVGFLEDDDDEVEPYVALGAEYDIGNVGLFGEFSWVDTNVSDLTIDILTVGVKYNFGSY
jgi:OOP family OmpA-OmpF porin